MEAFDEMSVWGAERRARLAAAEEKNAKIKALEDEQARIQKEAADARSREFNRRQVLAEYQRAGVKPPCVDESGAPICSLSLLIRNGWVIEHYGDESILVAPPAPPVPAKRRTREDYQNADGS